MQKFLKTKLPPLVIALVAVLLDQWTKALAVTYLKPIPTRPLIEGVFHFTYRENRGAAFSMFADHPWVFMTISTVAIIGMLAYFFWAKDMPALVRYPLGMVVGGGIGNMIDRVAVGFVVDFIDVRLINFAVFNVADCFVTVGAGLLFIGLLLEFRREELKEKAKNAAGENHDDRSGT